MHSERHAPTGFRVKGTGIAGRATLSRGSGEFLVPSETDRSGESPVDGHPDAPWEPPRFRLVLLG